MRNSRGGVGVWLFFAFLVLGIGVLLLFIFLHGSEPSVPVSNNVSVNVSFFNLSVIISPISGVSPVYYSLSNISFVSRGGFNGSECENVTSFLSDGFVFNGSDAMGCPLVGRWFVGSKFASGLFFPDKFEFYRGGVAENSTILLEAWSDLYYYNSSICNISKELYPCKLSLLEKAVDYSVNFNASSLIINISDGYVQKPIICTAFSYNVANVYVGNLSGVDVPKNFHWIEDECYAVGYDLSNTTFFSLDFRRHEFSNFSVVLPLSFVVRDFEIDGKSNIGDRSIFHNISFVSANVVVVS